VASTVVETTTPSIFENGRKKHTIDSASNFLITVEKYNRKGLHQRTILI
jgi:hypothetical protein